jgi:hypothetical protein
MLALVATGYDASRNPHLNTVFQTVRLFQTGTDPVWRTVRKVPLSIFHEAGAAAPSRVLIEEKILSFLDPGSTTSDWVLSVPPIGNDGFAIDLSRHGESYRLLLGELEEDFETLNEALTWVGRAMSSAYQLKVTMIGGRKRSWTLEPINPASDMPSLSRGYWVLAQYLLSIKTIIYRNRLESIAA